MTNMQNDQTQTPQKAGGVVPNDKKEMRKPGQGVEEKEIDAGGKSAEACPTGACGTNKTN